jgi:hypothetical protein
MKTSGDETSDHMESQIYDFRPIDRMISSPGEIHQEFEEFSRKVSFPKESLFFLITISFSHLLGKATIIRRRRSDSTTDPKVIK